MPYFEFLELLADASVVVTDSGGVSEEAAALGVGFGYFLQAAATNDRRASWSAA